MAFQTHAPSRTKDTITGHIPTNFRAKIDHLGRHVVWSECNLAVVAAGTDPRAVSILKPFRPRVQIQLPMDMENSHAIRSIPLGGLKVVCWVAPVPSCIRLRYQSHPRVHVVDQLHLNLGLPFAEMP